MAKRYWFRERDDAASEGLPPGESDKCFVLAADYDLLKAENERLRQKHLNAIQYVIDHTKGETRNGAVLAYNSIFCPPDNSPVP